MVLIFHGEGQLEKKKSQKATYGGDNEKKIEKCCFGTLSFEIEVYFICNTMYRL